MQHLLKIKFTFNVGIIILFLVPCLLQAQIKVPPKTNTVKTNNAVVQKSIVKTAPVVNKTASNNNANASAKKYRFIKVSPTTLASIQANLAAVLTDLKRKSPPATQSAIIHEPMLVFQRVFQNYLNTSLGNNFKTSIADLPDACYEKSLVNHDLFFKEGEQMVQWLLDSKNKSMTDIMSGLADIALQLSCLNERQIILVDRAVAAALKKIEADMTVAGYQKAYANFLNLNLNTLVMVVDFSKAFSSELSDYIYSKKEMLKDSVARSGVAGCKLFFYNRGTGVLEGYNSCPNDTNKQVDPLALINTMQAATLGVGNCAFNNMVQQPTVSHQNQTAYLCASNNCQQHKYEVVQNPNQLNITADQLRNDMQALCEQRAQKQGVGGLAPAMGVNLSLDKNSGASCMSNGVFSDFDPAAQRGSFYSCAQNAVAQDREERIDGKPEQPATLQLVGVANGKGCGLSQVTEMSCKKVKGTEVCEIKTKKVDDLKGSKVDPNKKVDDLKGSNVDPNQKIDDIKGGCTLSADDCRYLNDPNRQPTTVDDLKTCSFDDLAGCDEACSVLQRQPSNVEECANQMEMVQSLSGQNEPSIEGNNPKINYLIRPLDEPSSDRGKDVAECLIGDKKKNICVFALCGSDMANSEDATGCCGQTPSLAVATNESPNNFVETCASMRCGEGIDPVMNSQTGQCSCPAPGSNGGGNGIGGPAPSGPSNGPGGGRPSF